MANTKAVFVWSKQSLEQQKAPTPSQNISASLPANQLALQPASHPSTILTSEL